MIIFDNHLHLRPDGECVEAAKKFEAAGGTHLNVCHLPYAEAPIATEKGYQRSFEITLRTVDRVRKETGLSVYATLGPYPVDLLRLTDVMELEEAKRLMMRGMDLAAEHVREGRAIAIGEIGRPHFPVSEEIWEASNEILLYGMTVAKEIGCPVLLHTEAPNERTIQEIAEMADRAGIDREKVIKHYSPPIVRMEENKGLFPSILARRDYLLDALGKGNRFMLETDYLDDPKRPGAVLGPTTVPKRTNLLLRNGTLSEEDAHKIHVDWPERVYGIEME